MRIQVKPPRVNTPIGYTPHAGHLYKVRNSSGLSSFLGREEQIRESYKVKRGLCGLTRVIMRVVVNGGHCHY